MPHSAKLAFITITVKILNWAHESYDRAYALAVSDPAAPDVIKTQQMGKSKLRHLKTSLSKLTVIDTGSSKTSKPPQWRQRNGSVLLYKIPNT